LGVGITTRSISGRANSASGESHTSTCGHAARTFAGSLLDIATNASPGTEATNGAWKVAVAKPKPTMPTLTVELI